MEKKYNIGICLNALFSLLGIIASIISLFSGNASTVIIAVVELILYALIIYYTTAGYKIPHGNLLKVLMLLYALSYLLVLNIAITFNLRANAVMIPLVMSGIAYVAGRLDKVFQNRYLMCVILLLICIIAIIAISKFAFDFILTCGTLSKVFLWLDLCAAYFLRFKLHKEAGLMDKAEN